jgi:gas vesicle protein
MSNGSGSGFCTGLLVGAIAGLVVGLLYAPKPGKETREMVRERVSDFADGARNGFNRIKSQFSRRAGESAETRD